MLMMLFSMVLLYQSRLALSSVFLVFFAGDLVSLSEDLTTLFGLFQVTVEVRQDAAELVVLAGLAKDLPEVLPVGELFILHAPIIPCPPNLSSKNLGCWKSFWISRKPLKTKDLSVVKQKLRMLEKFLDFV